MSSLSDALDPFKTSCQITNVMPEGVLDVLRLVWLIFRSYLFLNDCRAGRGMSRGAYHVIWWVMDAKRFENQGYIKESGKNLQNIVLNYKKILWR